MFVCVCVCSFVCSLAPTKWGKASFCLLCGIYLPKINDPPPCFSSTSAPSHESINESIGEKEREKEDGRFRTGTFMLGFCFVYPRGEFEGWHHIIGLETYLLWRWLCLYWRAENNLEFLAAVVVKALKIIIKIIKKFESSALKLKNTKFFEFWFFLIVRKRVWILDKGNPTKFLTIIVLHQFNWLIKYSSLFHWIHSDALSNNVILLWLETSTSCSSTLPVLPRHLKLSISTISIIDVCFLQHSNFKLWAHV